MVEQAERPRILLRDAEQDIGRRCILARHQAESVDDGHLLEIARDLTSSLAARDRYDRLLAAVRRVLPYDAACLLRLEGDELVPIAGHGLVHEALVRRYARKEHPRLDVILRSPDPVRFPPDSALPDPFDGLIEGDASQAEYMYLFSLDQRELGELMAEALDIDTSALDAAPEFIQDSLIFPYDSGLGFVQRLHESGGWNAVSYPPIAPRPRRRAPWSPCSRAGRP